MDELSIEAHKGKYTMKKTDVIKSTVPTADAQSWYDYILKEQQESPARLEIAAQFLAGMISISLTLFIAIGEKAFMAVNKPFILKMAAILGLLSLLASFFVLFPWRYRYVSDSVQSFKNVHHRIVQVKRTLLIISLIFFLTTLCLLTLMFFF